MLLCAPPPPVFWLTAVAELFVLLVGVAVMVMPVVELLFVAVVLWLVAVTLGILAHLQLYEPPDWPGAEVPPNDVFATCPLCEWAFCVCVWLF